MVMKCKKVIICLTPDKNPQKQLDNETVEILQKRNSEIIYLLIY